MSTIGDPPPENQLLEVLVRETILISAGNMPPEEHTKRWKPGSGNRAVGDAFVSAEVPEGRGVLLSPLVPGEALRQDQGPKVLRRTRRVKRQSVAALPDLREKRDKRPGPGL